MRNSQTKADVLFPRESVLSQFRKDCSQLTSQKWRMLQNSKYVIRNISVEPIALFYAFGLSLIILVLNSSSVGVGVGVGVSSNWRQ